MDRRFVACLMVCVLLVTTVCSFSWTTDIQAAEANESDYCKVYVQRITMDGDQKLFSDEILFLVDKGENLEVPDWFLPTFKDGYSAVWTAREVAATMFNSAVTPENQQVATGSDSVSGNVVPKIKVTGDAYYNVTWDVSEIMDECICVRYQCTFPQSEAERRYGANVADNWGWKNGRIKFAINGLREVRMYTVGTISEFPKYYFLPETPVRQYKSIGDFTVDSNGQLLTVDTKTNLASYTYESTYGREVMVTNAFYGVEYIYNGSQKANLRNNGYKYIRFKVFGTSLTSADQTYYGFTTPDCKTLRDTGIPIVENPGYEFVGWTKDGRLADSITNAEEIVEILDVDSESDYNSVVQDSSSPIIGAVFKGWSYVPTYFRAPGEQDPIKANIALLESTGQLGDKIGDMLGNIAINYVNGTGYNYANITSGFIAPQTVPDYTATPSMAPYTGVLKGEVTENEYNIWSYYGANFKLGGLTGKYFLDEECTIPMTFDTVITKDICKAIPGAGCWYMMLYEQTDATTGFVPPSWATDSTEINETAFPDTVLRDYVQEYLDKDNDGSLSIGEKNAVKAIRLSDTEVKSLKGIENFPLLSRIVCTNANLPFIDLSENHYLREAYLDNNSYTIDTKSIDTAEIEGFDISKVSDCENLEIDGTSLVITDCSKDASYAYATGWANITGIEYKPVVTLKTTFVEEKIPEEEETTEETPSEETTANTPAADDDDDSDDVQDTTSSGKTTEDMTTEELESQAAQTAQQAAEIPTAAEIVVEQEKAEPVDMSGVSVPENVEFVDTNGNPVDDSAIVIDQTPVSVSTKEIVEKVKEVIEQAIMAAENAAAKAKVFYYDFTAYVDATRSERAQISGGGIEIPVKYPQGVSINQKIIVLHGTREVEVRKYETYFTFYADGFSPYTIIALDVTENAPAESQTVQAPVLEPQQGENSVDTADHAPVGMMMLLALVSAGVTFVCTTRRRKIER